MDCSIEIIGEVVPEKKIKPERKESDFEIIYDASSSKALPTSSHIKDTPVTIFDRRPVRTKRPIKTLREELQDEQEQKKRRSILRNQTKPRATRLRKLLTLAKGRKSITPTPKKKVVSSVKIKGRGIKREFNSEIPKKLAKAPRAEVGGAGTLKSRKKVGTSDVEIIFEWDPAKVVAERQGVEEWQAKSVINMFDQENTLPFIARYRKEKTGNMEVEKLREIQNIYSQLKNVQEKVVKIFKSNGSKISEERRLALLRATTMHEIDHLTASLKGSGKRTYAERAKELGLNEPALEILFNQSNKYSNRQEFLCLVDSTREGLMSIDDVEMGLQHIIADAVSKDPQVMEFSKDLIRSCKPILECSRKRQPNKDKSSKSVSGPSEELCAKYENYFNYKNIAWSVRPHQVLAMNRGENQNVLSVKVNIPEATYKHFLNFCMNKWLQSISPLLYKYQLIIRSIEDGWERLVKPFMQRQVRSRLTDMAEIASIEVFTSNLKKLLLTPPVRGKSVLAIDPGFLNGCKIGVTNIQQEVLLTTTIYPFRKKQELPIAKDWKKDHNARTLREIVQKYGCEYFAIGNGTACRQMEQYVASLITAGCFEPYNVQYTIINESGVSQYSVSVEAKSEFPSMEPNHISAVSLARRLQDPLLEYVKVHPMHLGVGMYQHDIPEKLLHSSLDSVMTECVSFVGLDINAASELVLRKLSGLNKTRAANIVEYRKRQGPFINREQLKSVKGIGPRTFEQCAGFIRIMPLTLEEEFKKTPSLRKKVEKECVCPLDRTMVHPESYDSASKFMNLIGVRPQDIGSEQFLDKVRQFSLKSSLETLAEECSTSVQTMQLIIEGLSQPIDFDIRAQFDKPLFRKGITSMNDLTLGTRLTGTVRNMTHFGAFVDIGVGNDGLIHSTGMRGMRVELGSIVEVSVRTLDLERGRINLYLERVM